MRNYLVILMVVCCCVVLSGMAQAVEYKPCLMYSTVLNGLNLQTGSAELNLEQIQAVFLPDPGSSSYYPYDPVEGGKLWAILSSGAGQELYRLDFYAEELKSPYWLMSSYKLTRSGSSEVIPSGRMDLSATGAFVLDFYLESGRFYTFPFSISKVASDDPFAGQDAYFLDGAWENWAYLYYSDADPDQSIHFKVWLRHKGIELEESVTPRLEVKRGGALVCTSREHTTYTLKQRWNRFDLDLIFPMENTSGGAYFKARDLLANDGEYTATLLLSGQEYASWTFKVKGGELTYSVRTERATADPLTFIEGGRDAWWYQN